MPLQSFSKPKPIKNKSGSILAFSLIILSMMLTIAVGIASVEMVQKKNASSTQFSVQAYQVADGGSQLALKKINAVIALNQTIATAFPSCQSPGNVVGLTDMNAGGLTGTSYDLVFLKADGTQAACSDLASLVTNLKSTGKYQNTVRAVNISVGALCGTYSVVGSGSDSNTYGTVKGADGNCWLDRNLGATQVATAYNDSASYGWYYQWGRRTDGHQVSTSGTTSTLSSSDSPGNGNFILAPSSPYDWRSGQNNALWQGVSGTNNPCPTGFRIPTQPEWAAWVTAAGITNYITAFSSNLKLTAAGTRVNGGGALYNQGASGFYWSSSVTGIHAYYLYFGSGGVYPALYDYRANGFSVRCIRDAGAAPTAAPSFACAGTIPNNSSIFAGDDTGLTTNTAYSHSSTGTSAKCEYYCNSGFTWNNSTSTCNAAFACGTSTVTGSSGDTNTYGTVLGADGNCWLDRNLGATQVATSKTDASAYGWYYEWGRATDGHQLSTSSTTATLATTDTPGNAFFITNSSGNFDWRNPQNNNLWQGVAGVNNPCPAGYRLPTSAEWINFTYALGITTNTGTQIGTSGYPDALFASTLKIPLVGFRHGAGSWSDLGSGGNYWSSSPSGTNAAYLDFDSSFVNPANTGGGRADGFSVRCIRN